MLRDVYIIPLKGREQLVKAFKKKKHASVENLSRTWLLFENNAMAVQMFVDMIIHYAFKILQECLIHGH